MSTIDLERMPRRSLGAACGFAAVLGAAVTIGTGAVVAGVAIGLGGGAVLWWALRWQAKVFERTIGSREAELDALRENEVWYWLLAENTDDVVWVLDPITMRMLYISPSVQRLRGYSPDEVEAEEIFRGLSPDSAALVQAKLPERIEAFLAGDSTATTWCNEIQLSRKGGGWIWVEAVTTLVRQPEGGLRMIGVSRSIEERKKAEAELRASEARFRSVVEAAPDAVLVEAAGVFAYVNPAAVALFGGKNSFDLLGKPVLEYFPDPAAATLLDRFSDHRTEKVARIDGTIVPVEGVAVRFRFGETGGTLVFLRDLTARNRARAELDASEKRFRELADSINEVFWVREPDMAHALYVSPAFERIWGVRPDEAGGSWLELVHKADRPRLESALARCLKSGGYQESFRVVWPNGEERWLDERAFPVVGEGGGVQRVVGVTRDITEQKRFEAKFLRAQRMEAVGALSAGVAHDLNNILTPILITAGALRAAAAGEHDRELVALIEQSARRGAEVIRQLLAFSRGVDGEKMLLQPRHLVREMSTIISETFPRSIALDLELPADLWPVEANSTQLHQVLINLCVNARDAMPAGGRLSIKASNFVLAEDAETPVLEMKPGDYTRIDVADTGCGMPEDVLARVFEPFYTTKETGKGTGLGLSTALGIVRSHGGHIEAESTPGRGSRFSVFLPARKGDDFETASEPVAPRRGHGELVLVVDDEFSIRETLRLLLQKNGYRAAVAPDGETALSMALQYAGTLRAVVTDVMMPEMDGTTLVRALRSLDPAVALIVASGLDDEERRKELESLGVAELLPKPCGAEELLGAIERALDSRR